MTENRRDPKPVEKGPDNWRSLALSVGLHVLLGAFFLIGWHWSSPVMHAQPNFITAELISAPMQQQAQPAPKHKAKDEARKKQAEQRKKAEERQKKEEQRRREEQARKKAEEKRHQEEQKRQKAQAKKKAEEKRHQEEARKKAEEKRQQEAQARKKAEQQRKAREAAAREKKAEEARHKAQQEKLKKLAQQALEQKKQQEQAQKLAAAAAAAAKAQKQRAQSEQQKYSALIRQRLENHWNLPPSAKKSMTTVVQIRLLPTGELAGVEIVKSSGNAAFDNSVLNAVRSISNYPVPDSVSIFNQYFRQFTIEFNPENLQ